MDDGMNYKKTKHMALVDGKLVGTITETADIQIPGFEGTFGTAENVTTQTFTAEGSKNLKKYLEQAEEKTQANLVKAKEDLARLGNPTEEHVKDKNIPKLIMLLQANMKKDSKLHAKVAKNIQSLDAYLTKFQNAQRLIPQLEMLKTQLKEIKEDKAKVINATS